MWTAAPRLVPFFRYLALLLGLCLGVSPAQAQEATRPNIVLILADDMGYSDIGAYGGEIQTPQLDELAANGLRYSQFRNTSRCCPTRAMLMTGLQPHQAGIGWMTLGPNQEPAEHVPAAYQGFLNQDCVTLAEALKPAGYATFMSGKWHLGRHDPALWPKQRGFDRFWGSISGAFNFFTPKHPRGIHADNLPIETPVSTTDRRFYTTDAFTDHAIRFVDDHLNKSSDSAPAPFFLYLAYNAPHWPMQAHEEDIAKYRGKYRSGWDELRKERLARQIASGLIASEWGLTERDAQVPAWDELDEAKQDEMDLRMAIYAAMVDRMDWNIGRLMDSLKSHGVFEDTLVLFLSDNGACAEGGVLGNYDIYDIESRNQQYSIAYGQAWANASNTPFRLYKHWSHEGGVATPFLAHWPRGIPARQDWFREPAVLLDLMPTVLELAGAPEPVPASGKPIPAWEGRSLVQSFQGKSLDRSQPLFNEHEGNGSMLDGDWKLVGRNVARNDGYHPENWELYQLGADRTERLDLAREYPERLAEMSAAWEAWAHRVAVFPKRLPPRGAPNVLLILADDLGFSDLGSYGGEIPTPHIDQLAAAGVRFSQFTNSARCCPSRASLLTGLHPHQTGVGSFATAQARTGWGPAYSGHLSEDCATLAELLGDAGYSTWMVGKWHLGIPGPIDRGFHNYYGYRDFLAHSEDQWKPEHYRRLPEGVEPELAVDAEDFYVTDVFTDYAREFLRQAGKKDQPWFLYLAHSSPHFPIQAPRKSIDRHVATYRRGWDVLRSERFERMKAIGLLRESAILPPRSMVPVDREDIANGFPGVTNPAWDDLTPARREDLSYRMATFAAMVEHLDTGVGKILTDLKASGELENTLILFLSDNGACYEWGPFGFDGASRRGTTTMHENEALLQIGQAGTHQSYGSGWANLGNTPLNLYKHFAHEGGIASPLIAHWPSKLEPRDSWVQEPTHIMDIVPTVLEAAGLPYPAARRAIPLQLLAGNSLLPVMRGETLRNADGEAVPERSLAFEHQGARALRRGNWKAVWGKREPHAPRWRLFDLESDRSEQTDLAAQHPTLLAELVAEWEDWARKVGAEPFQKPDQDGVPSLLIESRAITVQATIDTGKNTDANGVVLAQGGSTHGFVLRLIDGKPCFELRRDGQLHQLHA